MIRTLVVDDSKFMRTLVADMLVSDPEIDVIATAKDGEDAVAKAGLHHPDVITLDVEMPEEHIKIVAEDLGGSNGRTVRFDLVSGKVLVKTVRGVDTEL